MCIVLKMTFCTFLFLIYVRIIRMRCHLIKLIAITGVCFCLNPDLFIKLSKELIYRNNGFKCAQ